MSSSGTNQSQRRWIAIFSKLSGSPFKESILVMRCSRKCIMIVVACSSWHCAKIPQSILCRIPWNRFSNLRIGISSLSTISNTPFSRSSASIRGSFFLAGIISINNSLKKSMLKTAFHLMSSPSLSRFPSLKSLVLNLSRGSALRLLNKRLNSHELQYG